MPRRKEKRECDECGISALDTHLEYVKSQDIYLCEYCLASSDYEEAEIARGESGYKKRTKVSNDDYESYGFGYGGGGYDD